jgi:hypothetical protein
MGAVAAALAVALAGCTAPAAERAPVSNPSPTAAPVEPAPTPTPTPTPELTPEPAAAPVRPPEMDQADEAGALAAAEYALLVAQYAVATGDLTEWDRLSTSDCGFCSNIRASVREVYERGGRLTGGEFTLGNGSVVGTDPSMSIYAIDIPFESTAVDQYDESGALVTTEAAGSGTFTLEVMPAAGGWRLLEAGVLDEVMP